jgi:phenylacetate-CoA ligase
MRESLYRHVILPTYETVLHGRMNFRYWRALERSQWLSREEVERIQLNNLQRLIEHARKNCRYYDEAWRSELADGPASLEDFRRWPVIQRETILRHRVDMRAQLPGIKFIAKSTGGSTGVPLHFDYDTGSEEHRSAAWYRGYKWGGAAPGVKQLWLWGVPLSEQSRAKRWKDQLYASVYRRKILNCFELSDARIPAFLDTFNRYRPDAVVSYTNAIYTFALELERRGLKAWSPKSIVVGAEKLHDFQRMVIERVFGAPVFETYGSREFMLMGAECDRHEGLHLTMENLLIEVLDDQWQPTADGEEGNVVVTDLFTYGMPFVRYANGVRAVAGWSACSCGRGLPLLKKVIGRRLDVIHTPDGRRVPGELFPHLMKDFEEVKRFVVIQESADELKLEVVISPAWVEGHRERIAHLIQQAVGAHKRLLIREVDDIPLTAMGKLRVVINRMASGCGGGSGAAADQASPIAAGVTG